MIVFKTIYRGSSPFSPVKRRYKMFSFYKAAYTYSVPININTFWNFGVLAMTFLGSQIITGFLLACHYLNSTELAFNSVEHIMRNVNSGWLLRYFHANGASMFFTVVYIHMFRGLYYSSYIYPRNYVWTLGVAMLLLMIITAFLGYVLPWGQMSYWAAIVITNLAATVPIIGDEIIIWLWGGFSVAHPTLVRFYAFHFILPFILLLFTVVHLMLLHMTYSSQPLGFEPDIDTVQFGVYFIIKDILAIAIFGLFFGLFCYYYPNTLSHSDNYIKANALVTPSHIVPEWYFLPFYAILRSVPNKLLGVLLLLCSILILFALPYVISHEIRNTNYRVGYRLCFFMFFFNCFILGWIGCKAIESPYYEIGQLATVFYFSYFLIILPFFNRA